MEPASFAENAERLFDSQNNAKGGYSAPSGGADSQPSMYYFAGSTLELQWNTHTECSDEWADCDIILQYMCSENVRDGSSGAPASPIYPNTPSYCDPQTLASSTGCNASTFSATNSEGQKIYGYHEDYDSYDKCFCRERNKGLFTADLNVANARGATATRQNPNGNNLRNSPSLNGQANHGFECPEERDYWPYWHPAVWRDIAVFTTRSLESCQQNAAFSQNVASTGWCQWDRGRNFPIDNSTGQRLMAANSAAACVLQNGTWVVVPPNGDALPPCIPFENARFGSSMAYNWTLPSVAPPSGSSCVIRIRLNVTSRDFVPFASLTWQNNGANSPVRQNPWMVHSPNPSRADGSVDSFLLALDTSDTGRTFQDRSHAFRIEPLPNGLALGSRIHNLNVCGKRGNYVQVFPALPYAFVPSVLVANVGDYVHIQFSGSADGSYPQGLDGEGSSRTDRFNMVGLQKNQGGANLLENLESDQNLPFKVSVHTALAWINQAGCLNMTELIAIQQNTGTSMDNIPGNCGKLNAAQSSYFDAGLIPLTVATSWSYFCTRNNDFSRRLQKGVIVVQPANQQAGNIRVI